MTSFKLRVGDSSSDFRPYHSSRYIPAQFLVNLKKYKYSGTDSSIISYYVMQPYWNFVVSLVPMTVAPNMLTFIGFLVGLSSFVLVMIFYFFYEAVYPGWVWYYACFAAFFYQTLDAIDGKQARRTGTSSPLGEIFDHGCDAFLIPFFQLNVALAVNAPSWMIYCFVYQSLIVLYATIFEQYYTGTLHLTYINGPTEGILLLCGIFLLAGRYSKFFFDQPIIGPYSISVPGMLTAPFTNEPVVAQVESLRSVMFIFFLLSWVFTLSTNIMHMVFGTTILKSKLKCIWVFPTVALMFLHCLLYAAYPNVAKTFPFMFELSLGFFSAFTVTTLTIARLCMLVYWPFNLLYFLHIAIVLFWLFLRMCSFDARETASVEWWLGVAMMFLTISGAVQYIHLLITVLKQMSSFFGIRIMSIHDRN